MPSDDIIELIEPTPKPQSRRCKLLVLAIAWALTYGPFIIAALIAYLYTIFYGVAALLISYLVIGIIRSKLRNSAIPRNQLEYHYTDHAIASWFVDRELFCH